MCKISQTKFPDVPVASYHRGVFTKVYALRNACACGELISHARWKCAESYVIFCFVATLMRADERTGCAGGSPKFLCGGGP